MTSVYVTGVCVKRKAQSLLLLSLLPCWLPFAAAQDEPPAYQWAGGLTLESVTNLDGGIKRGSRELANLDLTLAINTGEANWWSNGEWFIYALGDAGKDPSAYTGDVQGVSNIAADESLKIYEFWYQHSFADDSIKVLVGLHDYNSTFYSLEFAGLYNHPSFGIGPDTSQVGPSIFPTTATALHITYQGQNHYLIAAVYDGVPGDPDNPRGTHIHFDRDEGLFSAVEWGWVSDAHDKIAVGAWQHTAEVTNPVDGTLNDDNTGVYIIAEKNINDVAGVFVQLGRADDLYNQLEYYAGTGITFNSFWIDGDGFGLAVAHARNGDPYLANNEAIERAETAWELSYFSPVIEHVSAQASLYYIQNPSMDPVVDDAVALGVRAYIEF